MTVKQCPQIIDVFGSVFLRNCANCIVIVACEQFRLRDCNNVEILLACATQPIIEASTTISVGPFAAYYPQLKGIMSVDG